LLKLIKPGSTHSLTVTASSCQHCIGDHRDHGWWWWML